MSNLSSSQVLLDQLRGKMRTALYKRKWGDARDCLKQLKSIDPDNPDDASNLEMVLQQGRETLATALKKVGDIRSRLLEGDSLEDIQSELANHMLRWRAFEDDFPELKIVAHGLEEHENPEILKSMEALVGLISTGQISQTLEDWDDLGRPSKAGPGIQIQILSHLSDLTENIEEKAWSKAKKSLAVLEELQDSGDAESYRPGLKKHLTRESNWIRWNILLARASAESNNLSSSKSQTHLLEELTRSADEIQLSRGKGRVDDDFIEAFDEMIERASSATLSSDNVDTNRSWIGIIFSIAVVAITLILIIWYQSSGATP